ncbi:MAG: carbon-nitrogen hydrolase family protein [Lentisphaeria bacterium]
MKNIRIALIQFDAEPEAVQQNLQKMNTLGSQAAGHGARWIVFHEGTVCDYTPRLKDFAEPVPGGPSTQAMIKLAQEHDCFVSFGLSETDDDRYFITQAFIGPGGLIHRYRKTWLWHECDDKGYRDEWTRYDPGAGPELFTFDDVAATCFICADGDAPRCIARAKALQPEVVFFPNNRQVLPDFEVFGAIAGTINAPMLVTNRTGHSWMYDCKGGSVVYSAKGAVLAQANREGKEEMLIYDLEIRSRRGLE